MSVADAGVGNRQRTWPLFIAGRAPAARLGDGATAKTADPSTSHTWTEAGDLVVTLVVHDANGTDVTAQQPISVCYGFGADCTPGVTKCCGACVTSAGNPSICGYP